MKNCLIFLIIVQTAIYSSVFSQINDDFSDGNFTATPTWIGDTMNFSISADLKLQLNAPAVSGQSYVSTPSNIINEAEWSFQVNLEFNPSSSNYMDIYLVSDQADLENPLNGYFVRLGNTQDEISLYKQSGAKSSMQKIIDGTDKQIDLSLVELGIKVTKSQENTWELFVDYDLSGNYISEGTVMDNDNSFSNYFGIVCTYTSTRSDKFFFDDLSISGKRFNDDIKPIINTLLVTSDSTLQIIFSEKITTSTATDINNYLVDKNVEYPYSAIIENDTIVMLSFQSKFENKAEYLLTISGIEDLFSNAMENTSISFTYKAPYLVGFNDILITEIMADPSPGVDLPEFEYLEIFNPHQELYTISNINLVVGSDTATLPDFTIMPGEYIILCQSAALDHFTIFGRTMKVTNWPTLNNSGEPIALLNSIGKLVFSIAYDDSWYKSIEKDDGGWSLEMIDLDFPCKGSENWKASTDPSGGTPGRGNASADQLTDLSGPEITKIIAESSSSVIVYLNEKIGPQEITTQQITTYPELEVQEIQLDAPEYLMLRIDFSTSIAPKTQYELTFTNLHDCIGNAQKETTSTFVLPEPPDSLDLIINEILFNPWPDGVDFVELYNQSDKYIDLQSMQLANDDDIKTMTNNHFIIEPRQFLALTENPEILNNYYPGINPDNILEVADMPAFNDDEGKVSVLSTDGNQVDFFQYSDGYHSGFLKETEGVSLERISFEGPTNNSNNWQSAASTAGYATPGKMNSQFMPGIEDDDEVTIDPLVFDPGNSGSYTFTTIKCRFQQTGNMASIKIVDTHGRVIKTILSSTSIGAEEDFKWEGDDDKGQEVRMGPYIVFLEIYTGDGYKKLYRKKVVVGGRM